MTEENTNISDSKKMDRRRKIQEARKSMEYKKAEESIQPEEIQLTTAETQKINDLAETQDEAQQMVQDALSAKKHQLASKRAKSQVNQEAPIENVLQKPSYGHVDGKTLVHSTDAYRLINGRNAMTEIVNGKRIRKQRIIGLWAAASGVKRIEAGHEAGCPYATWTLVQIEEQIEEVESILTEVSNEATQLLAAKVRIQLSPFTSKNPTNVHLDFRSNYAYVFANLLCQYDELLCNVVNYKIRRLITAEDYRKIADKAGRVLRKLYRTTGSWQFVGREAVEQKTAKLQEAEYRMGMLPDEILSGKLKPKML